MAIPNDTLFCPVTGTESGHIYQTDLSIETSTVNSYSGARTEKKFFSLSTYDGHFFGKEKAMSY